MNSVLPPTGTAQLLKLVDPFIPDEFINQHWNRRPLRGPHRSLSAAQMWRVHLLAVLTPSHSFNQLAALLPEQRAWREFAHLPHRHCGPDARMFSEFHSRVGVSGLRLIRLWLKAPVVEETDGGPPTIKRNDQGTPQGGVISPLLANIYLHWFDKVFHRADGPAHWAKAKLARYQSRQLRGFIEGKLEQWLGLVVNREKTRVVNLKEPRTSLDFLGYTFRFVRDRHGGTHRYLNLEPSVKALAREREVLRQMTGPDQSHVPLPALIQRLNRHLRGWGNYFKVGCPREARRGISSFVRERLTHHLHRRSQRGYQPPEDLSFYEHLNRMGLIYL